MTAPSLRSGPSPAPRRNRTRRAGIIVLGAAAFVVALAPLLAPNSPSTQFADRAYAPPSRIHLRDAGGLRAPFVYRQTLEDRVARRFAEDRGQPVALRWFTGGRLVSVDEAAGPLLLLGADTLGRDVFARLLYGAWLSLGVALVGAAGAIGLGALVGLLAGTLGGRIEAVLMLLADFVLVLPAAYLVLVLRGALPLHLSTGQIFWMIAVFFVLAAWPVVARGVRAIVSSELARDYAVATRAAGAGPLRLARHLLPAASGFLRVQVVLVLPALILAEVTLSFLGLGFGDPSVSWGTMLQDLSNFRVISEAPWMLAPAAAVFFVALGVQMVVGRDHPASVLHLRDGCLSPASRSLRV